MMCHMAIAHDLENLETFDQKVSKKGIYNLKSENNTCTYCAQVFSSSRRTQCHLAVLHEPKALKQEPQIFVCTACQR